MSFILFSFSFKFSFCPLSYFFPNEIRRYFSLPPSPPSQREMIEHVIQSTCTILVTLEHYMYSKDKKRRLPFSSETLIHAYSPSARPPVQKGYFSTYSMCNTNIPPPPPKNHYCRYFSSICTGCILTFYFSISSSTSLSLTVLFPFSLILDLCICRT
jgi:hypothetical protein